MDAILGGLSPLLIQTIKHPIFLPLTISYMSQKLSILKTITDQTPNTHPSMQENTMKIISEWTMTV